MRIEAILKSAKGIHGKILVVAGVIALIFGVLFFTPFYQWISVLSFFVGVNLLVVGIFVQMAGPLRLKTPSAGGLGFILIYMSVNLLAIAAIAAIFTTPDIFLATDIWRTIVRLAVVIAPTHPYAWIFRPLVYVGFCFFIVGSLLIIYNEFR